MRHRNKHKHFSRNQAQRRVLIRSLVRAVLLSGRITTTDVKAKAASSGVDKIITLGKQNTLHARRRAYDFLQDHGLVKQLFDSIAPRFRTRNGGYTRVLKIGGFRKGDGATMSLVEFVDYRLKEKEPILKKSEGKKETIKEAEVTKKAPAAPEAAAAQTGKKPAKGLKKIFKKKQEKES